MLSSFLKKFSLFFTCTTLFACSNFSPKYTMDEDTRDHPATQRFIQFAENVKTAESFEELQSDFYTTTTQRQIAKAIGWRKLVYSAPYQMLKNGTCDTITLIPQGTPNRALIDCMGTILVKSMFIEDRVEAVHLRVIMIQQGGAWFFDKAGYVNANTAHPPVSYSRFGMKFKSELETER